MHFRYCRVQLCTHLWVLICTNCTGSEVKPSSDSQMCAASRQGSNALPSPHTGSVVQQLKYGCSSWYRPTHYMRNLADCGVKPSVMGCDFIPLLLLLAIFVAVVNLVPLIYTKLWSGLVLLPTACAKRSSVPLAIAFPFGLWFNIGSDCLIRFSDNIKYV